MKRGFVRSLLVTNFLMLLVCPLLLLGQAQRAIIQGRVLDSSGAVVPGADIKVIQESTNIEHVTATNESGNFEVPSLFPGIYRIEASRAGFKTAVVADVPVTSGQRVQENLKLELGQAAQTVTVTAGPQVLETANADESTTFNKRALTELPNGQGNTFYTFRLVAGVNTSTGQFQTQDAGPTGRYSFEQYDGSPQGTAEYTLDGAPDMQQGNSGPGGSIAFIQSPDMLDEVTVQTTTFDASVGHSGGGGISFTLKQGTNEYHGSAIYFGRDNALIANSWQANRVGISKPNYTYRRWGFSGGGPVWLGPVYHGKERTFFYFAYEHNVQGQVGAPVVATVPTAAQLNGDFSSLLALGPQYQLYSPLTGILNAQGQIVRQPFLNNIIPHNRLDPTALKLGTFFPKPNQPGTVDGQNNFAYLYQPLPVIYTGLSLRIDHNLEGLPYNLSLGIQNTRERTIEVNPTSCMGVMSEGGKPATTTPFLGGLIFRSGNF